jgi:hypothetical protein
MDELTLLKKVEDAARRLREPVGYESGATSHDLDDALRALDEFRVRPVAPRPVCIGHVVHPEFSYCPACEAR